MKRCWGESCALFFISAGGITAALFAGYLVMNFFAATGVTESMNDPIVLAIAAAIFLLMWIIMAQDGTDSNRYADIRFMPKACSAVIFPQSECFRYTD